MPSISEKHSSDNTRELNMRVWHISVKSVTSTTGFKELSLPIWVRFTRMLITSANFVEWASMHIETSTHTSSLNTKIPKNNKYLILKLRLQRILKFIKTHSTSFFYNLYFCCCKSMLYFLITLYFTSWITKFLLSSYIFIAK